MNKDYKFYGDEYLALSDIFGQMPQLDQVMFSVSSGFELLGKNEIPYITNAKKELMKSIAWTLGVNRVYKSNPEKYKKIWSNPNRRIKVAFLSDGAIQNMDQKSKHSMFQ